MMKICRECGKFNMSRGKLCTKCGAPLDIKKGERCTIQGGFSAIEDGNFAEATYRWVVAAKNGEIPDDEQYALMVKTSADCIRKQLSDSTYYSREGVSELTRVLPGRRMNEDLLMELADSLQSITTKSQLARLAGEYMFLVLDSFNVHPDIRDMVKIMNRANEVMIGFQKAIPVMTGTDKSVESDLDFYIRYTTLIADKMNSRIYREGRERLSTAVEFWSSRSQLSFAETAIEAARAYSKVKPNKESDGRKTVANDKIDEFLDEYFTNPFKQQRTQK